MAHKLTTFITTRPRKQLIAVAAALSLVLLTLLGVLYALFLNDRADRNIKREPLLPPAVVTTTTPPPAPTPSPPPTASTAIPSPLRSKLSLPTSKPSVAIPKPVVKPLTEEQEEWAPPSPIPAPGPEDKQPTRTASQGQSMNYLIIGSDHRGKERGRSDVIMVVHTTGDKRAVHLVHFPRDYFVRIPGYGYDKINSAYSLGGAPLLVKTLQPLLGVPLDHVAILDFAGFERMTDAVGGVDVTVPAGAGGGGYTAGKSYHLAGAQALAFVRERKSLNQGDMSRGKRQMAFVQALLAKGLSPEVILNPGRFTSFLDAGTRNVTVDNRLSMGEMRSTAWGLREVRGNTMHSWSAPWTSAGRASNGRSVVFPAKPQLGVLAQHLRTDSMNSYRDGVSPARGFSR